MLRSMTGYGKGAASSKEVEVEIELKSLNNKYLEVSLKLPSAFFSKEFDVKEIVKAYLKRGKVIGFVNIIKKNEIEELSVDQKALQKSVKLLKEIKRKSKIKDEPTLDQIIIFYQKFFNEEEKKYSEVEFESLKKALKKALESLNKMRLIEGKELQKDILKRIKLIENYLTQIEQQIRGSVEKYFNDLKERAKKIMEDLTGYDDRLKLELAMLAEKSDLTEETTRLRSHLKFFVSLVEDKSSSDSKGSKLNFLCQEMNREANTISAKSLSSKITHLAVSIKEEVEKIREQVQNIE